MWEWKYRQESKEKCSGGKYGSGNIGTVLQGWKTRESRLWNANPGPSVRSDTLRSCRPLHVASGLQLASPLHGTPLRRC